MNKLLQSLFLFKALIKAGCEFRGNVSHRLWSEQLFIVDKTDPDLVDDALAPYTENVDYRRENDFIYIK